jgi:DNA (cytosine-5)-methyltransferase 1
MKTRCASCATKERKTVRFLSLFAGIGGFDLGLERAGMQCVGQVEIDKKCQAVLAKHWPTVTRMGDIRDVKGNEFGTVDLICGGFPCQPFSTAGKRKGEADNRFLWPEMVRVIAAIRPAWVLGENVAGIVSMALDKVHSDLESIGYTVQSFIIPACSVGAIHRRDRVWIIGNTKSSTIEPEREICGRQNPDRAGSVVDDSDTSYTGLQRNKQPGTPEQRAWTSRPTSQFYKDASNAESQQAQSAEPGRFYTESGFPNWGAEWPEVAAELCGMDDGVSGRVDRLKQLGNAVVPQVVEIIGRAIMATERAASMPQENGLKKNTMESLQTAGNT